MIRQSKKYILEPPRAHLVASKTIKTGRNVCKEPKVQINKESEGDVERKEQKETKKAK
jgi:hypothetical protein